MIAPSVRAGRIWDEATSPEALQLTERFENRWRASSHASRPDPGQFLPADAGPEASGLLLALLRADMTLRREAGEVPSLEAYRERYPRLADEALVALIYEDLCLREEAGERPDPAEYEGRFPALRSSLREVLEIHSLIRSVPPSVTTAQGADWRPATAFLDEAFPTIAGFHLIAELGRGSFARVFLAQERQLANRPVALKVSVTGSREPQALARLQHTHIVPVHSYRVDPATDLHLLVMPYFGRLTLAKLLADPLVRAGRTGASLVEGLDRLIPLADGPATDPAPDGPTGHQARRALASRSFGRAVAWWGAQLADALRHAHDRGVLHRDLKPSNILLTRDGVPMILDFNLAREVDLAPTGVRPGGTLAYMAPEHLAALLGGDDRAVDHRADLYALGLILAEMLGIPPLDRDGPREGLTQLLDRRRRGPLGALGPVPRLGSRWQAVLNRCLQADPDARHADAGELAADLHALADDAPLVVAREPALARAGRWARAHRRGLGVGALGLAVVGLGVMALVQERTRALRQEWEVSRRLDDGDQALRRGEFVAAQVEYARVSELTRGSSRLAPFALRASQGQVRAGNAQQGRLQAEAFHDDVPRLQFAVLGFGSDPSQGVVELREALAPLNVLGRADWVALPRIAALDAERQTRLIGQVDDLLFLWAIAAARSLLDGPPLSPADRQERIRTALAFCDQAQRRSGLPEPWLALRSWWLTGPVLGQPGPRIPDPSAPSPTTQPAPSAAAFRWFLLGTLGPDRSPALVWLRRAVDLGPSDYWPQFVLGFELARAGDLAAARARYDVATALRPNYPWAWLNRGLLARSLGDWTAAHEDFTRAEATSRHRLDRAVARLEQGRTALLVGDHPAARRDLDAVVALDPQGLTGRAARVVLARLEAATGAWGRASAHLDAVLADEPRDWAARSSRANLALRRGHVRAAGADLDALVQEAPEPWRTSALRDRAALRLVLNRLTEAQLDLDATALAAGTPASDRLADRLALALGREPAHWPDRPAAWDRLPRGASTLRWDLRALAEDLANRHAATPLADQAQRALLRERRALALAAARDASAAQTEADQLVEENPRSARARLIRATIRWQTGAAVAALAEIAEGLRLEPDHAALLELRGEIRVARGDYASGRADLADAWARGQTSARGIALARAWLGLGQPREAAALLTQLAASDPTDVETHLLLATAHRRDGRSEASLAALEAAAQVVQPRSWAAARLVVEYSACLARYPNRLGRVLNLVQQGWLALGT